MTASSKRHPLVGREPLERAARFAATIGAEPIEGALRKLIASCETHQYTVTLVGPMTERRVVAQLLRGRVPNGLVLVDDELMRGTNLVLVAAAGVAGARTELRRLAELGFVRHDLAVALIGQHHAPGTLADAASQVVVIDATAKPSVPTAWVRLIELFTRRMAEMGASATARERSNGLHRALLQLRHLLMFRLQALAKPHVAQFEAARIARYVETLRDVMSAGTDEPDPELSHRVLERLETERTKLLMASKADLLAELADRIAALEPGRHLRTAADAIARDLLEATVFVWRADLRLAVAKDVGKLDHAHRDRLRVLLCGVEDIERALDTLAGGALDPFASPWRLPWSSEPPPSRLELLVDSVLPSRLVRQRAVESASRMLLARLEAASLGVVTAAVTDLGRDQLALERRLREAVEAHAEAAAGAARWADAQRAGGPLAVERAQVETRQWLGDLAELAQMME